MCGKKRWVAPRPNRADENCVKKQIAGWTAARVMWRGSGAAMGQHTPVAQQAALGSRGCHVYCGARVVHRCIFYKMSRAYGARVSHFGQKITWFAFPLVYGFTEAGSEFFKNFFFLFFSGSADFQQQPPQRERGGRETGRSRTGRSRAPVCAVWVGSVQVCRRVLRVQTALAYSCDLTAVL